MSHEHDSSAGMPRRAALQVLLGGAAGFAVPAAAEAQHPIHQHLANPAVIEQAQQRAAVTAARCCACSITAGLARC